MNRTNMLILILIALILAFSGCVQLPELSGELPEDFEAEYGNGAMHAEWGQFNFKVDKEGNAVFEKTFGTDASKKYDFVVSKAERKKIYDAVVTNDFFSLNDLYEDPFVINGGWSKITITANGKSKTVTLLNEYQEQFEDVENEIEKIIISEVGIDAFSINDLRNE